MFVIGQPEGRKSMEYVTGAANIDESGSIDSEYYLKASIDIIDREAERMGVDKNKLTTNRFNGYLREVYRCLFRPDGGAKHKGGYHGETSKPEYTEENAERLAKVYIELCGRYDTLPSIYGFCIFSGIDDETANRHLTRSCSTVSKSRKNAVLNKAYDHPVGVLALANNDPETGLMFARQNMITAHEVKHCDDINELENMRRRRHGIEKKDT